MKPAVRQLMEKITVSANRDYPYQGQVRMTVRKKDGSELIKETSNPTGANNFGPPVTHEEIIAKYHRICAFMHVADGQKDRALAQWSNLRAVKDIAEPMQTLAKFGRPLPL
jgi:2-methylcitrate dehydratase PrpD